MERDIFAEIKDRVHTRDVVSHYGIKLRKRTNKFWGICPFHNDKKPSFCVFTDGGWKCFSCGTSGADVISFAAAYFGLEQKEAAQKINDDMNLDLDLEQLDKTQRDWQLEKRLESKFEKICFEVENELCARFRLYRKIIKSGDFGSKIYEFAAKSIDYTEYCIDILQFGDIKHKIEVIKYYKKQKGVILNGGSRKNVARRINR